MVCSVIARRWRGRVPAERTDGYLAYIGRTALADYAATPGHLGTIVLQRTDNGIAEVEMVTIWESQDAIRAYVGGDICQIRCYPEERDYLLETPGTIEHWEVVDD